MTTIKTLLPNGVQITEEDDFIAAAYSYRCVAHPMQWMSTIHEEPPKSKNPHWKSMPETRFPVCDQCHQLVHRISRIDAGYYLEQARGKNFPNAVKELERHVTSA